MRQLSSRHWPVRPAVHHHGGGRLHDASGIRLQRRAGAVGRCNRPSLRKRGSFPLIKGFFDSIPHELDEAARIDGAGHFRTFTSVILPLIRPVLAVTGLLVFVSVIAEYILAGIFLTDNSVKTLAVGLFGIIAGDRSNNLGVQAKADAQLAYQFLSS